MEGSGGFLLINEQRTGKTQIALAIAEHFRVKAPNCLLIICPKGAIKVWEKAIKEEYLRGTFAEIQIVNYEQIRARHMQWYKWGNKRKGKFIIIADEVHRIKDRGSGQSRSLRTLRRRARYALGLTGTPIEKGLEDAWALFDFINSKIFGKFDNTLAKDRRTLVKVGFEGRYLIRGGFKNKAVVGYQNEEEYKKKFHANSYRITLDEAKERDGMERTIMHYRKSFFNLTGKTQTIYDDLKEELIAVVNQKTIKVKNILACCTKLQQVTGGFLRETWYEDQKVKRGKKTFIKQVKCQEDHLVGQEKLAQMHQELRSMQGGTKFLIVCRHVWEIETIHAWLFKQGYRVQVIRGGLPYSGKMPGDGAIMQIASAIAVDMSQADTIFFYSTDYSSIKFQQALFRILSYSKGGVARYVFLLARGTVDELIYDAISQKKKLADLVIDKYRHRKGFKRG
jgi:superfamily II DNA or RNA helicase